MDIITSTGAKSEGRDEGEVLFGACLDVYIEYWDSVGDDALKSYY